MTQRLSEITGVLLAGGKSRRMGIDKRLLSIDGATLFERSLQALDDLFINVVISLAGPNQGLPIGSRKVVFDAIPGCATLGGLYSAWHIRKRSGFLPWHAICR